MRRPVYNGISSSPHARVLTIVLGSLLLLSGFVFSTVILSLGAIAGLVLAARLWWLRRQLQRQHPQPQTQAGTRVIEGEFRVLHRDCR